MKRSWLEHNGGLVEKIETPVSSKRNRGLQPTYKSTVSHSTIIVRNGEIITKQRYAQIVDQVLSSRAKLDAENTRLSPKFSAESPVTAGVALRPSEARSPKPTPDQPARPDSQGAEQLMTKEPGPGHAQA